MTKKEIISMLDLFSGVWEKSITDNMVSGYFQSLKNYPMRDVQKAGYKCMETLQYFPKPSEIIKLLKIDKYDEELRQRFTCPICKTHVSLLIEGRCKHCAANLPLKITRPRIIQPKDTNEASIKIEPNIQCQLCGSIRTCIFDIETESWQCRQCYTGFDDSQINNRYQDILSKIKSLPMAKTIRQRTLDPRQLRRETLGFEPGEISIMSKNEELDRKELLLQQYHEFKENLEDLPF